MYGFQGLDAERAGTTLGTRVIIWDRNGGANQQWSADADGTASSS